MVGDKSAPRQAVKNRQAPTARQDVRLKVNAVLRFQMSMLIDFIAIQSVDSGK